MRAHFSLDSLFGKLSQQDEYERVLYFGTVLEKGGVVLYSGQHSTLILGDYFLCLCVMKTPQDTLQSEYKAC